MKVGISLASLILAGTILTGCKSEAEVRNEVRSTAVASCRQTANTRLAGASPAAVDQYCTCVTDRVMTGRSLDQIANVNSDPAAEQIAIQCATQAFDIPTGGATGNATTPAPEPANAAEAAE